MSRFWCSGDSTSKRILDVLESFYLRLWKIIVQRIAVVEFRMYDRSGDGAGSSKVKIRTNTAKLLRVQCRRKESSRSLSHLLMSFLLIFSKTPLSIQKPNDSLRTSTTS